MATWGDLTDELDRWAAAGRVAGFWWRDDDAVACTTPLDRLTGTADEHGAPVALAIIPAQAASDLLARGDWPPGTAVLQHGLRHENHAPASEKKAEFGDHRSSEIMMDEIQDGRRILAPLDHTLAVFVPPWNRICARLIPLLPMLGMHGLSTFGPRETDCPPDKLNVVNTHVDPIDWRGSRGYAGDQAVLKQAVGHLSLRRTGGVDPVEPTGLLTHHLVHDEDVWRFLGRFLKTVADHPAARWMSAREVFCR